MAAQWYCLIGQQQYGPFTSEQIRQLVLQGQLQQEHFVRTETDSRWTSAGDLPGLFPPSPAVATPPSAPSVTPKPKKQRVAPTVSIPSTSSSPTAQAPAVVPSATPVAAPPTAVPVAAPVAAVPVVTAAPVAVATAAARPVAAAPRAAVAMPAVAPAEPGPAPPRAANARAAAAARPIPLNPVSPPAPASGAARGPSGEHGQALGKRSGRKSSQLVVGGLGAALLLLIIVAVVVLNRSPSTGPDVRRGTASSSDPGGDPEIETSTVTAAGGEAPEIADPVQALTPPAQEAGTPKKAAEFPPVGKWLVAGRQKGGLREVVRLAVGNVWRESADGKPDVLNVEIQVTNLSPGDPLDFSGWRLDVQPDPKLRAVMADDEENVLTATPPRTAAKRPPARRRIDPGQSETELLCFLLPERDAEQFRLALPYAVVGQVGYLGFELPAEIIRGRPPGEEDVATKEPPTVTPETLLPASEMPSPKPGEPETIGDLRTEIKRSADAPADPVNDLPKPAADDMSGTENEPKKIPDIRKLIEDEEQEMEPTQEREPNEKPPLAKPESP